MHKNKPEFEEQWLANRAALHRHCRLLMRDSAKADDLFSAVAWRAYNGYASFAGRSSFLTWVKRIATNEAISTWAREKKGRSIQSGVDPDVLAAADGAPVPMEERAEAEPGGRAAQILDAAVAAAVITEFERTVLTVRAERDNVTWSQLAEELGVSATAAPVIHCRAMPRVRAFLLLDRPDFIGGPHIVEAAIRAAARAGENPLTSREAALLRSGLSSVDRRASAKAAELRSACSKVWRHLPLPPRRNRS